MPTETHISPEPTGPLAEPRYIVTVPEQEIAQGAAVALPRAWGPFTRAEAETHAALWLSEFRYEIVELIRPPPARNSEPKPSPLDAEESTPDLLDPAGAERPEDAEPSPLATGEIRVGRVTYGWAKLPLRPKGGAMGDGKIKDETVYKLTGPRGAVYWLTRNVPNPAMLFAINDTFTKGAPFKGWFTDKGGALTYLGR